MNCIGIGSKGDKMRSNLHKHSIPFILCTMFRTSLTIIKKKKKS